ncbi:UvrD-helicase domain-containing protein [Winogradskyella sp. PE311]|uniref:UvrD-helicase domain-containing protein n=1 Tax=Winogradskyella sp. PE311 TaxID=3366943 RepID=UPI00397E9216
MRNSSFQIYNASAGSGKTFTLAKSYLKILIESENYDRFKSILAITFTNKAVSEMKERIISMLKLFSTKEGLDQPHPMFTAICNELSISPEFLHSKSKNLLKYIIHNYGAFDVSTVDGFTHRIIRTFAHDLKLPVNFEVELDQDRILNEAVDRLISKAGTDKILTNILIDFAIEKADDDKSWDVSYDFNKIAKLLVSENDLEAINSLSEKTILDFKELKLQLAKEISTIDNKVVKIANNVLNLIDECGLQFDDFNRKSLPNYFKNISQSQYVINFESNWQNDLMTGDTLYPKRVTEEIASTINSIQPKLCEAFIQTKTLIFELKLKKGLYKNITPLSVLNAIKNELIGLKDEQNKMLISEFNKIISQEIKDQPTPFIYERLGEKFKHYFIDEFQDTSTMQWENLVPLLDNALSASNGSLMLVGDAKQAIYRWRGGEAEQFINLYNKFKNPFQIEADVLTLDTNFRSAKEIINFNNELFQFIGNQYFNDTNYGNLYLNAHQNTNSDLEGFVNLNFLEITKGDDASELYASEVLKTIEQCLEHGYTLDDICVIIRKRKEGIIIANYLSERGINITSSETLLLKNSNKIQFLNSFLKLLLQPKNDILKIEVLSFLANQNKIIDKHSFYTEHLRPKLNEMLESLKALNITVNKKELLQLPLYELIEQLIRVFKLNKTSDAYLQFYLDVVLEFTQKQNSDLAAFLDYFDKKKDSLSVVSPENADAIQIMTIHKSKGLEFPIVLFPFAELNIYQELEPKVWYPTDGEGYNGFKTLLLNFNNDLKYFGETGNQIYNTHKSQLELDNINLLYVVLTRAVEQLYVISKKDINSKGVVAENTYSGMLISYLKHTGKWLDDKYSYSFGTIKARLKKKEQKYGSKPLQLISVSKEDHNLSIITKSGLLWDTKQETAIERGNLIHLLLSKIKTHQDIDFAFNDLIVSGDINKENFDPLKLIVNNVITHPKLETYFQPGYKVYNERDIITESGELVRPDRLNINTKKEVVIIDYKTGEQKEAYGHQLKTYSTVLESMNYTIKHKLIIYINDTVEVIEV